MVGQVGIEDAVAEGLARQRGTNLLFNGNLYLHSFSFHRLGTYPDDPQNPETGAWGNAQFPLMKNAAGPYLRPFLAVTTLAFAITSYSFFLNSQ